jgi:uncharacterized protein (DUF305 family)
MSGRIKLLKNGLPISENNVPALGYSYDTPGLFDQDEELQSYAECIDAMDCAMMSGMTTGVMASDEAALFIHQMIPHHQNAVNMAKTLLKSEKVVCADLSDEDSQDCVLERILREIINGQNHQIQLMNGYLEAKEYSASDNCVVEIKTLGSSGQQIGIAVAAAISVASLMML